jgi:hypothetical protein
MNAAGWVRHEFPEWERMRGNTAEHGLCVGGESWIVLRKNREPSTRRICWVAIWGPAGFRGIHPHIVIVLFATRRLAAAKALCELWAAASPGGQAR